MNPHLALQLARHRQAQLRAVPVPRFAADGRRVGLSRALRERAGESRRRIGWRMVEYGLHLAVAGPSRSGGGELA